MKEPSQNLDFTQCSRLHESCASKDEGERFVLSLEELLQDLKAAKLARLKKEKNVADTLSFCGMFETRTLGDLRESLDSLLQISDGSLDDSIIRSPAMPENKKESRDCGSLLEPFQHRFQRRCAVGSPRDLCHIKRSTDEEDDSAEPEDPSVPNKIWLQ